MRIVWVAFGCLAICIGWYANGLQRYYRKARSSGLPIYLTPIDPASPLWLVLASILGYDVLSKLFPKFLFDRVKLTIPGWEFRDGYEVNERFGDVFILVSPGSNTVFVADPDLCHAVLARRKDFGQVKIATEIMGVFGPNVLSADHEEWQRYRRLVAPELNERIMQAVWTESTAQAAGMLAEFTKRPAATDGARRGETTGTFEGLKRLTINIIMAVDFGARRSWAAAGSAAAPPGYRLSFTAAMLHIVHHLYLAIFVPPWLLKLPFMPQAARDTGVAKEEYPRHLRDIIAAERQMPEPTNTLVSALVRAADRDPGAAAAADAAAGARTATHLSEREIAGNLFAVTVAGFDTMTNTLVYAVMALAIHPEWQDWLIAQIDAVEQERPVGSPAADYATCFPRLTRVLALMYETLRLHTPLPHVARVAHAAQPLGAARVPAGTLVQVGMACAHVAPRHWGPDPCSFRPARWLVGRTETPLVPPRGTFMPWSGGPRVCPGMKMAEVEFVAVVRAILSRYRIEAVPRQGESPEAARARLQGRVDDSSPRLTMQMNKPDVLLRYVKRKSRHGPYSDSDSE